MPLPSLPSEVGLLTKPAHLEPGPLPWSARAAALIAAVLGAVTFVVVAVIEPTLWTVPDWHVSVPGFALTAIVAGVSIGRRERAWPLLALGVGLAGASLVLGWVFALAIVLAAAIIAIVILHAVL